MKKEQMDTLNDLLLKARKKMVLVRKWVGNPFKSILLPS